MIWTTGRRRRREQLLESPRNDMPSILLIDPDPFFSNIYAEWLRREGFDVRSAMNGEDALRAVSETPSAIIMELALPRLDGFGLLERLREDPTTKTIPAFVLTDMAHRRDIDRCAQLGAHGYMLKAHSHPDEVVRLIRAAISPA